MFSFTKLIAASALAASVADAVAFNCHGINYNIRAGPDWADASTKCKPASQIATELATLKQYTDRIRLYSLTDCDQATAVVPAAIAAGLKIELGLWVDSYPENYAAEKAAFETLLTTGIVTADNIVGIHVGSEAIYRGDVDYDTAVSYLKEIRALCEGDKNGAADIPLTITDVGNTYRAYPDLVDVVDYVSANLFPFWDTVDIAKAASYFLGTYERLVNIAAEYEGNKTVVIGETGWPYNGTDASGGVTSKANAAQYFRDFYLQAKELGIQYYYFSSFDESWKAEQYGDDSVEPYFGLWSSDGVLHEEIAALTIEDEVVEESTSASASTSASDAGSASDSVEVAVADIVVESSSSSAEAVAGVEETVEFDSSDESDSEDDDEETGSSSVTTSGDDTATESTATNSATTETVTATSTTTTTTSTKSKDCPM